MKYITLLFLSVFCLTAAHSQVIVPVAGNGENGYTGGAATACKMKQLSGITLDNHGNLYICDGGNHVLRKVSPAYPGMITTIAGNTMAGPPGDGGPATAAYLQALFDVAIDHKGNAYLADATDNRIRKVAPDGIITTVAGTGVGGYNGDGIAATTAMLHSPLSVEVDDTGNLYIADRYNNRLRKVDTFGIITTVAGTGIAGYTGDGGPAITAQTNGVLAVATDSAGNIYFSDSVRVRRISPLGIVSTVAGNGLYAYSGDGGHATAASVVCAGLSVDKNGQIFIADPAFHRIRKVDVEGNIFTIAGNGLAGDEGNWGNPLLSSVCGSHGVAVASDGDIYFSNQCSYRVKMITMKDLGSTDINTVTTPTIRVAPNPATGRIRISITGTRRETTSITVSNMDGKVVSVFTAYAGGETECPEHLSAGVYVVTAAYADGSTVSKIVEVQ